MVNKKIIRPVAILLIVSVAGAAWWFMQRQQVDERSRLTLYGNVDIREVDLSFNNSEHIDTLLVQEGDQVKQGQLLATLHKARVQATYTAAEAKVAAQKAVVARLEAGSRPEEISQARATVAAAKARLRDAEASYNRTRDLYKKKVASRQAIDDAEAALSISKADLKVAEESMALAVAGPREEDIAAARAILRSDEAQQVLAAEVLKDTELYAPANGIIRNRILEPGDMATPQTPVFTLAKTSPVWVRTYAPETVLGKLAPGMRVEIATDSYPDKTYHGWIGYMSPTAEFTPKNVETPELRTRLVYQLRAYVCNPANELRLGMPATVNIALDQPRPVSGFSAPDCSEQDHE